MGECVACKRGLCNMAGTIAIPAAGVEPEVAEGLLGSPGPSDQRMPRKVPIALTLLLAFGVAALTLGGQSKGVVANLRSKVGLGASPSNALTTVPGTSIYVTRYKFDLMAVAGTGLTAGDKAGWVKQGTCKTGTILSSDLTVAKQVAVPENTGVWQLCYQKNGDDPTVQKGQALRVIDFDVDVDGAWGLDYSALMAGKSLAEIKQLDQIIRYGAADPGTDATATWLKNYHDMIGGQLPAAGPAGQLKKLDMAASKMFSALHAARGKR